MPSTTGAGLSPATPRRVAIVRGRYKGQSGAVVSRSPAKTKVELPSGQEVNLMSTSVAPIDIDDENNGQIGDTREPNFTHDDVPASQYSPPAKSADAEDVRKGRGPLQVAAVGLVPAIFCVLLSPRWVSIHGCGTFAAHVGRFELVYLAYLACCCADTMASELGSFASCPPRLLINLQPVAAGTDGAISFEGLIAALLGSYLIACPLAYTAETAMDFPPVLLAGLVGCMIDSLLGCLIQPASLIASRPELWKPLNSLVNLLSASTAAILVFPLHDTFWKVVALLIIGIFTVAVSPTSEAMKRNILHSGAGSLILYVFHAKKTHVRHIDKKSRYFRFLGETSANEIVTLAVVLACVLIVTPHTELIEHSNDRRPGTFLYSGAVAFA